MNFKKVWLVSLTLFVTVSGFGQRGEYTHDGFFLNLGLGVNFSSVNTKVEDVYDVDFTGAGSAIDILVGGSPTENFALHATIRSDGTQNPNFDDGNESGNTTDTILGTGFWGVGCTVYSQDNFFFSTSIGRGAIVLDNGSETITSDGGLGLYLRCGKEWWVGKQWGLGVSLDYLAAGGTTDLINDQQEKWTSNNFSISFSATLN